MRLATYFLSLLCSLPCVVFALGLLVLGHAIATKNVFKILYHFLLAFGWGVPALALALVCLLVAGFFPQGRLVASVLILLLDLAAVVVILASPAAPKTFSEALFLVPAVISVALAGFLVLDEFVQPSNRPTQPRRAPDSPRNLSTSESHRLSTHERSP